MKRPSRLTVCVVASCLACAMPARAHFLWLLPWEVVEKTPAVHMNFSEDTRPDRPELLERIAQKKGGPYGIRVLHKESKGGEWKGKEYKEVRHYATLTLQIPDSLESKRSAKPGAKIDEAVSNAAATRLLADARAARAVYRGFPDLNADIEVNIDGKVTRGSVEVSAKGKLTLKLNDADAEKWAKHTLASTVGHRLGSGTSGEATPCAFVDDNVHHALGRAIRVLSDEFHSSYRIRDHQVIVVNRQVPGSRFTITVMENVLTKEKKFLPACFVVNTWDAKTDALKNSETNYQTWQRIGAFDLPKSTLVVKASAGKLESRSIKLSNVYLK